MLLDTTLPLSHIAFKHWAPDGSEVGVVVAKAAFRWTGTRFSSIKEPPELNMADLFEEDPATSPLVLEQDLAPSKPVTDIFIRATARSPLGRRLTDWPVSVTIPDVLHYGFHVRGPSAWTKNWRGKWKREEPREVLEVPLTYALAYGGILPQQGRTPARVWEENPAGLGFVDETFLETADTFDAPQIGELAEFAMTDPLAEMSLRGTGPIAKAWLPRRSLAGTFDDDWKKTRHPRMPDDYDLRFWNAAARGLQTSAPLRGDETIEVEGLGPDPVRVTLPGHDIRLQAGGETPLDRSMTLDTVDLDLRDPDPTNHTVSLVWRTVVAQPDAMQAASIGAAALVPEEA